MRYIIVAYQRLGNVDSVTILDRSSNTYISGNYPISLGLRLGMELENLPTAISTGAPPVPPSPPGYAQTQPFADRSDLIATTAFVNSIQQVTPIPVPQFAPYNQNCWKIHGGLVFVQVFGVMAANPSAAPTVIFTGLPTEVPGTWQLAGWENSGFFFACRVENGALLANKTFAGGGAFTIMGWYQSAG